MEKLKPYNEQEYNRLCAEFIGWKHYEGLNSSWNGSFETVQSDNYFFNRVYTKSELKFHSDWNWIMEVWEKIKLIPNFEDWYDDLKLGSMRNMICGKLYFVNAKEAVTQAIWQFLNWYNEQKQ